MKPNYYFRMKVKSGNSLFHLCLDKTFNGDENQKLEIEDKVHQDLKTKQNQDFDMIVGYDYSSENLVRFKDGQFYKITSSQSSPLFSYSDEKTHPDDYFWFALAASEEQRDQCKVLIFGYKYLFIFSPTGELKPKKGFFEGCEFKSSYVKVLKQELGDKNNYMNSLDSSLFLPLKLEEMILRSDLPPAIDSLSVYQYLNQGAFRPLYACGKDRDDTLDVFKYLQVLPRLDIEKTQVENDVPKKELTYTAKLLNTPDKLETVYSSLIRFYLDNRVFPKISSNSFEAEVTLFCSLLSPLQLETAATYYLIDQGYVPDTVSGGSLDHVDIRGRKLDSNEIEELQCKNYDHKGQSHYKIFEPLEPGHSSKKSAGNKIYLSRILIEYKDKGNTESLLYKWFLIQKRWFKTS
jgi:hypothetical protein